MSLGEIALLILGIIGGIVVLFTIIGGLYALRQAWLISYTADVLAFWAKKDPLMSERYREMLTEYFGGYSGIAELEKKTRKRLGTETKADKAADVKLPPAAEVRAP